VLGGEDGRPAPARIVLESDGKETVPSDPDQPRDAYTAARAAKEQGVQISTISFGTPDGYVEIMISASLCPSMTRHCRRSPKSLAGKRFKPTPLLAKTINAKGVPEIEHKNGWHGKALLPDMPSGPSRPSAGPATSTSRRSIQPRGRGHHARPGRDDRAAQLPGGRESGNPGRVRRRDHRRRRRGSTI
jgi:hypothetical protein